MRKSLKKIVSAITAGAMALALGVTVVPSVAFAANDPTDEAIALGKKDFDPNGEYNAYFMFQADGCWVFRDPFFKKETGMENANWDKMLTTLDVEEAKPVSGEITDVKIKGNGTYTVGVKGLNGCVTNDGNTHVKIVGVTTDIPSNDTVKITNVKTKIDGITKLTQDNAIIDEEATDAPHTICFNTANSYRNSKELKTEFQIPNDSVEVTFTVAGFAKDNLDAVEATPTPAKSDDKKDKEDKAGVPVVPIAVGVAAVVVIAGAIVVVSSKKKK